MNAWAKPAYVIVSGGQKQTIPVLKKTFSENTQIYSTRQHGAIVCQVDKTGNLTVKPFRRDDNQKEPPVQQADFNLHRAN
ncbi:MAG TPA: hypothetical protein DDZ90_21460 [Planctomycetaceae bacterium]|nr:hypothetical protein [Planctomycetaceae bacterium]